MVRDAYSAGGQQPSLEADGSTPQNHLLDIRSGTANLTQELAQLLAASIAQGTPSKRPPTGAGSELASLAALVSASQNQRTVSPTFRDGLSALSYTPPPPSLSTGGGLQSQGVALQPTGGGLQLAEHHDDEPMPIPSTWRQPIVGDDERWYRQQVGAAVLGLVAGLVVVVPAVLWLSGWLGGPQTRTTATRQPTADQTPIKTADVKPVKVQVRPVERVERTETASQYATAAVDPRVQAEPQRPLVEQTPVAIPAPRAEPPRPRTRGPAGPGRAPHRGRRHQWRARDPGRGRRHRAGTGRVRAGRDLRPQHAGGLGNPWRGRRRGEGQGPLHQGARPRREPCPDAVGAAQVAVAGD